VKRNAGIVATIELRLRGRFLSSRRLLSDEKHLYRDSKPQLVHPLQLLDVDKVNGVSAPSLEYHHLVNVLI